MNYTQLLYKFIEFSLSYKFDRLIKILRQYINIFVYIYLTTMKLYNKYTNYLTKAKTLQYYRFSIFTQLIKM